MSNKKLNRNYTHHLKLHFGDWITYVPEDKVLMFVSIALNHCVHNESFKIKGYLIRETSLYLVIILNEDPLTKALEFFSEQILVSVRAYLKDIQKPNRETITNLSNQNMLFTQHQLLDYDLIKRITGKEVTLSYHNPRIAYLKDITHQYKYCSVQDYKGVLGPVIVDISQTNN